MSLRKSRLGADWTLALLIHTVFCVYIISTTAYWSFRLWQRRSDFGIVERKKSLIRPFSYSLVCWMFTRIINSWMTGLDLYRRKQWSLGWYLSSANTLVATASFLCVCAFLCLRVWLIFFDVSLATANSDTQWIDLISQPVVYRPDIIASLDMINNSLLDDDDHPASRHGSSVSFRALSSITSLYREPSVLRKKSSFWGGGKSCAAGGGGGKSQNTTPDFATTSTISAGVLAAGAVTRNNDGVRSTVTSAISGFGSTMSRSRGFTSFFSVHGPGGGSGSWFIRAKYSFGNERWFKQQLLWVFPVLVTLITVPQIIRGLWMIGQGLVALTYAMCAIFPAVMAYNFPKFNDTLRMMAELRLVFLVSVVSSVGFAAFLIVDVLFEYRYDSPSQRGRKHRYDFWSSLASNSLFLVFGRLLCLSQTKWVLLTFPPSKRTQSDNDNMNGRSLISMSDDDDGKSNKHEIRDVSFCRALFALESLREYCMDCSEKWAQSTPAFVKPAEMIPANSDPAGPLPRPQTTARSSSASSSTASESHDSDVIPKRDSLSPQTSGQSSSKTEAIKNEEKRVMKHLTVTDLLADERGYRQFIQHLFNEFSYESLLCVIELQQFSDSIRESELNKLLVDIAEEDSFSNSDDDHHHSTAAKVKFASDQIGHAKTPSSMAKFAGAVRSMISLRSNGSEESEHRGTIVQHPNNLGYTAQIKSSENMMMSSPETAVASSSSQSTHPTPYTLASIASIATNSSIHSPIPGTTTTSTMRSLTTTTTNTNMMSSSRVVFPDSIEQVKSSISWDLTLSKEQRYCILCKKYIAMDAEMSVNISFDNRQQLMKRCDYYLKGTLPMKVIDQESMNLAKKQVSIDQDVFDGVIAELIRLMRDSLTRFQLTEEYESLRMVFHKRKHKHVKSQSTLILGSIFSDDY